MIHKKDKTAQTHENCELKQLSQISIVLAPWCPHCVPLSLEETKKMASDLKVPLRVLDIDNVDQAQKADDMVQKHGDFCEDYLVPQVFLEYSNGIVQHLFTGFSEDTRTTKKHWDDLFSSSFYKSLKN